MQKMKFARRAVASLLAVIMTLIAFTANGAALADDLYRPGNICDDGDPSGWLCEDTYTTDESAYQPCTESYDPEKLPGQSYGDLCDTQEPYCHLYDDWRLNVTGDFYKLRLLSIENGIAISIINQYAGCNGFYATSDNFTNWELTSPFVPHEYINEPPHMDLSKAGILVIERLPYKIDDRVTWVGFATLQNTIGEIWREQIRIFVDGVWLNPLPPQAANVIAGMEGFSWAREAIEFVVARNLMVMYPCHETQEPIAFNPTGQATRGDVLAAAVKALGLSAPGIPETAHTPFYDVPLYGHGTYIDIAKQMGLVIGVGNNNFAPEHSITRQDMMTMLYNILMSRGQIQPDTHLTALGRFSDFAQISSYARLPISSLARAGIITGDGVSINPRGYVTRAEAAMFVRNLYQVGVSPAH